VYDLQAYFERYFKGQERVRLLPARLLGAGAELAPRLRIQDRARLFGVIWGGIDAFGQLYIRLYTGLQGLNFAADASAGLERCCRASRASSTCKPSRDWGRWWRDAGPDREQRARG